LARSASLCHGARSRGWHAGLRVSHHHIDRESVDGGAVVAENRRLHGDGRQHGRPRYVLAQAPERPIGVIIGIGMGAKACLRRPGRRNRARIAVLPQLRYAGVQAYYGHLSM
jgi:hypothetical protein